MSAPSFSALAPVGAATADAAGGADCAPPFNSAGTATRLPSAPPRRNNSRRVMFELLIAVALLWFGCQLSAYSFFCKNQLSELLEFMKTRPDPCPVPLRGLATVVIHAIEVRAPLRTGLGRNVLQRTQQRVGNEKLRAPALNRRV